MYFTREMNTPRPNKGYFDAAKLLIENSERIAAIRERNQKFFKAIQNPTPRHKREAMAMDAALAKTQKNLETDAMALNSHGMKPHHASTLTSQQKIAARKQAENT